MRAVVPLALATIAALGTASAVVRIGEPRTPPPPVDFAEEVLPILATHCFRCHGGVREMAGLNLSDRDRLVATLRSGHAAVVPGRPARSELLSR
ncbi:MAG: c-type cytochrome domain-containing protein, partial [bacterium]